MRTSHRLRALLVLLVVLVLVAAACGDDDDSDTSAGSSDTPSATTTTAAGSTTESTMGEDDGGEAAEGDEAYIDIEGFQFMAPASVAAGSTLEIRNMDSAPHTVTADDGAFDSDQIDGGGEGSITVPSEPGTYAFHCEVHPNMKGELVVT